MKHSIRFRLTAITVILMSISFVLLWIINNCFLEQFYYENKVNQMIECYAVIQYCATTDSLTKDEIKNQIQQMKDRYNLSLLYMDEDWEYINEFASLVESLLLAERLKEFVMNPDRRNMNLLYSSSDMWICETKETLTQTSYLYGWGIAGNTTMFIMRTPLESIAESTRIASQFLFYTGIAVVLIAMILVSFSTRSMTNPILQLAELSKRMSHLDFKERYKGKGHDEIAILGNSMNAMADQLEASIAELKETNEQLKREIDEKIQIDEMRKEFLSNVSHELKTPIALIQGYAEGLQEVVNEDPESRDYYCEVIIDEAAKMNVMVRKLLTLNHLEFGQDVIDIEEFNLADLIRSVVQAADIIIQQKSAKISLHIPEVCIVKGDEFKIEEVLTNYISNGLNHLDYEKQIEVTVEEILQDDGKQKVRVHVFNTGDCIPEEELEKVWIKFYKVDKARTREYGGSGIGLSIVKAIMDSHHQPFGVRNRENGVEFWFELERV